MPASEQKSRITPADIESKLRALQGEVQGKVDEQKANLTLGVAALGLVLVFAFYFLGRRSGIRRSTLVEIRRV